MELLIQNGDYVPDGSGGFRRTEGILDESEKLQTALFKLTARRGSFPFLPELGSNLYRILREKPSARKSLARQYAAQALEGEDLTVTDVKLFPKDGGAAVEVWLETGGKTSVLKLEV